MRALIFDLDGTLWDAVDALTAIWSREMRATGVTRTLTQEDMVGGMGLGPVELAAHLVPELPPERRKPFFDHVTRVETEFIPQYGARLYPGLVETLRLLSKDYLLMIASNCVHGYIEAFLRYAGVEELISDFAHPGVTGLPKAGNIRLLMERNAVAEAVMVGDTALDYEAACGANVPFIHAAYGFGQVPAAKWRIDALPELPEVAAKAFSE